MAAQSRRYGVLQQSPGHSGPAARAPAHVTGVYAGLIGAGLTLAAGLGAAATLAGAVVLSFARAASTLTLAGILSSATMFRHGGLCVVSGIGPRGSRDRRTHHKARQCCAHQ